MENNNTSKVNTSSIITAPFFIEELQIDPLQNILISEGRTIDVQPKLMDVLCYLCSSAEKVVSTNELIEQCWPNQYISDSPVHKCIAQLRKLLNDNPKSPTFIKTVPKKGYVFIGKIVGLSVDAPAVKRWEHGSPYPGNAAYNTEQADIFFGREQAKNDIVHWLSQVKPHDVAWLAINGAKRSGKTSLINAGIIPQLSAFSFVKANGENGCSYVDWLRADEAQNVLDGLIEQLEPAQFQLMAENETTQNLKPRTVVVVDHIEVLLNGDFNQHQIKTIFEKLERLATSTSFLLITATDSEHLSEFTDAIDTGTAVFHYALSDFSLTELTHVIQKPVELAGLSFELSSETRERLDNEIIHQLQFSALPIEYIQGLLAYLVKNKEGDLITFSAYEKQGGVFGYLAICIDEKYRSLPDSYHDAFKDILFHLLVLDENGKVSSNVLSQHVINDQQAGILEKLDSVGVLTKSKNEQTCYWHLIDDSLIENWHVIVQWKKAHLHSLYLRHDLQVFVSRWLYHEKSDAYLIPSTSKIKQIKALINSERYDFTTDELALIQASNEHLSKQNRFKKVIGFALAASFVGLLGLSVSLVEKNNQLTATRDSAENLISFILYDLKEKLEPLGKLELLDLVASKSLDYFKLDGVDTLSGANLYRWAAAQHILGEVEVSKHNYQTAEAYFLKTSTALEKELLANQTEKALELYMHANYWRGYLAYVEFEYDKVTPFFEKYLSIANTLVDRYPSEQWLLEKSYALNNLGSLAENQNKLEQAADYYQQSYQLKADLLEQQPDNLSLRQDLADTLSWQSNIEAKKGELKRAISYLQKALNLTLEYQNKPVALDAYEALVHHKLALHYIDIGKINHSKNSIKSSQDILKRLINHDEENTFYVRDLVWSLIALANVLFEEESYDRGLVTLQQAESYLKTFNKELYDNSDIVRAELVLNLRKSHFLYALGQSLTARELIDNSLNKFDEGLLEKIHPYLYSKLKISRAIIFGVQGERLSSELSSVKTLLDQLIEKNMFDFKAIFLSLTILKLEGSLVVDNIYLQRYQQSDFQKYNYLSVNLKG